MVQVLTPGAHVPKRAPAGPDAVGDAAGCGERPGEGQPADQGRPLARAEVMLKCGAHSTRDAGWRSMTIRRRLVTASRRRMIVHLGTISWRPPVPCAACWPASRAAVFVIR